MARSRVRGTNGQPRKKNKNRDSLRASIQYTTSIGESGHTAGSVKRSNDGDPSVYYDRRRYTPNGVHVEKTQVHDVESARYPLKGKPKRNWIRKGAEEIELSENGAARERDRIKRARVKKLQRTHRSSTSNSFNSY